MFSIFPILPEHKRPFFTLSLIYFLLALTYGIVIPIFEAPDENIHYFTAEWIADNGRLPYVPQTTEEAERLDLQVEWTGQEAAQPPLYYLLASLVIAPLDTDGARQLTEKNLFVRLGDARGAYNKNGFLHGANEQWPWRGHVLAVHLLRMISTVIGWGTLLFIYGAALFLWPDRPDRALWSIGFVALLPQFIVLHAAVSNDVLVIFLVTFILYMLLQTESDDFNQASFLRADLWLGIGVGLAALSKNQGIVLAVFVLGSVLIRGIGRLPVRVLVLRLGRVMGLIFLIAGWLWVRNWLLYGDITATNQFVAIAGGDRGYTLWQALAEWRGLWLSSIAVFGWFNVIPPLWVHRVWTIGGVTAVTFSFLRYLSQLKIDWTIAGIWAWLRSWPVLLFGWVLAVSVGLVSFMMQTPAAQGRLLFPALLPIALLIGFGCTACLDWRNKRLALSGRAVAPVSRLLVMFVALFLVIHVYLLTAVISPAYAQPSMIAQNDIPQEVQRQHEMGAGLRLVAADIVSPETGVVANEEFVELVLYWEKTADIDAEDRPEVVVDLFGYEQMPVGKIQTFHGGGNYPADFWPEGAIIIDHLQVPTFVSQQNGTDYSLPVEARVLVKLAGEEMAIDVGGVKLMPHPDDWAEPAVEPIANLGDLVEITNIDVVVEQEIVTVDMSWHVIRETSTDWVTFVHLGLAGEAPIAQGDRPPRKGHYRTSLWEVGEYFEDTYSLVVPEGVAAGEYRLILGMYDPTDPNFARLPVSVDGVPQAENAFFVTTVIVD